MLNFHIVKKKQKNNGFSLHIFLVLIKQQPLGH